jgi:hypothetical protein
VVSDPFPPFHFEAVPDPDQDPTARFRHVGIQVMTYIHSSACLYCFIFLVSFIGVIIFNILNSMVPVY